MSLVQKQSGASKGRKLGVGSSKRPSLGGVDTLALFFKAGELEKRSARGFWQRRHFETLNSYLCYWKSAAKTEMCGAIDLRELAAPAASAAGGAAGRLITLRRDGASAGDAGSFVLRARDRATAVASLLKSTDDGARASIAWRGMLSSAAPATVELPSCHWRTLPHKAASGRIPLW